MADAIPSIPPSGKTGYIDSADVRMFITDKTLEDNPLDMDLFIGDPEIGAAMRFAAKMYNETPPLVHSVNSDHLPFADAFLHATASYAYLAKIQELAKRDIDYSAGGLTVDIEKRRLDHLERWFKYFKAEATRMFKEQKIAINIDAGYRAH